MTFEEQYQSELTYFKMNMLQCEIEMQGMIANNKIQELKGEPLLYDQKAFTALIEKHNIYHNQFPFPKH